MTSFFDYLFLPSMWLGLLAALEIAAVAIAFGLVLGLVLAIGRDSRAWPVRIAASSYVWIFRGTPILLQLVFLFNVLPTMGLMMSPVATAMIGFALNEAAYCAEILRGGLRSVSATQTVAADSLGMNKSLTLRKVVLPQAMRAVLPSLGNEVISLVKLTSIASVIAVTELTFRSQQFVATTFEVVPVYSAAAVIYLVAVSVLSAGQSMLEARFGERSRSSAGTISRLIGFRTSEGRAHRGSAIKVPARLDAGAADTPFIAIRQVSKTYAGKAILRNVSLDITAGEVVVLMGRSGSGKSTLLRLINHLESVDGGEILVDGRHVGYDRREDILTESKNLARARANARIGMVFQHFNLFENMSALDNVAIAPINVHGIRTDAARRSARQLLHDVGLTEQAQQHPSSLSGGQQQRVAIARAMAINPTVILFDEPTSALDPELVGDVLATIRTLAESGMTLIIVTHQVEFARDVADRVVFLADGEIVEVGPPQQVLSAPKDSRTRQYLGTIRGLA